MKNAIGEKVSTNQQLVGGSGLPARRPSAFVHARRRFFYLGKGLVSIPHTNCQPVLLLLGKVSEAPCELSCIRISGHP